MIRAESPRAADWLKVMGSREIAIKSPLPHLAILPDSRAWVFDMDLEALTPEQRARLIAHLAERFHLPVAEVEANLDQEGCPVLDEDVTVTISHPWRWI